MNNLRCVAFLFALGCASVTQQQPAAFAQGGQTVTTDNLNVSQTACLGSGCPSECGFVNDLRLCSEDPELKFYDELTGTCTLLCTAGEWALNAEGGNVGIGIANPAAALHIVSTTEQLRLENDDAASSLLSGTIDTFGRFTFALTGSFPRFTFSHDLYIHSAVDAILQLAEGGSSTSFARLTDRTASEFSMLKTAASGLARISISALPDDGTGAAQIFLGRDSLTSGAVQTFFYNGVTLHHRIGAGSDVVFNLPGGSSDFIIEGDTLPDLFHLDAGNDRIGMGTSAASVQLHVLTGGTAFTPTLLSSTPFAIQNNAAVGDAAILAVISGTSGNSQIAFGDSGDDLIGGIVYDNATDAMAFRVSSANRVLINSGGDVGIVTSTPTSALQIGTEADHTDSYLQVDSEAGAPPAGDCDAAAESGRMIIDHTNDRLYVCNESSGRGWDFIALTD